MGSNDKVTLTIDGIQISVDKNLKLIDAIRQAGIYIPSLCYDPKIVRFGGCRLCVVDVTQRGRTRSKWSCCEPVSEGMTVATDSPSIRKQRQVMMEFLLMDHPLDCPECQASGNCGLQDAAYFLDLKKGRFPLKRRDEPLVVDNPVLERNYNRCIMCGKCVGVCIEVQGNGAIDFQKRGFGSEVGTAFRLPLDCDFCGQCLAICPTGSFQDHTEKGRGKFWEYEKVETVCPYCAVGCSFVANTKNGTLVKVTSKDDIGINRGLLCAKGRFGHEAFSNFKLKDRAYKIKGEKADLEATMNIAASWISDTISRYGSDSVALLAGEYLLNEDGYSINRFMKSAIKSSNLDTISNLKNKDLNSSIFDCSKSVLPFVDYGYINEEADLFFNLGADIERENPVIGNLVRIRMRDHLAKLFIASSRNPLFTPIETARLNYRYGQELSLLSSLVDYVESKKEKLPSSDFLKSSNIDSDSFRKLADSLISSKAPLLILGSEIYDHPDATKIVSSVLDLAKLVSGKVLLLREYCNSQGMNDLGLNPDYLPGYLKLDDPLARDLYKKAWGSEIVKASASESIFDGILSSKIKLLILVSENPLQLFSDYAKVRKALDELKYLIVISPFEFDLGKKDSVYIPSLTSFEKEGSYTNNEGRIQKVNKVLSSPEEIKAEWEIFDILSSCFGLNRKYKESLDVSEDIACNSLLYSGLYDLVTQKIDSLVVRYDKVKPQSGVQDIKGKSESLTVLTLGKGDYPYLALTGNSLFHIGSFTRFSKALNEIEPKPYVEINPDDAMREKIFNDDLLTIESDKGTIKASAKIEKRSPSGMLFISKNFEESPVSKLIGGKDGKILKVRLKKVNS